MPTSQTAAETRTHVTLPDIFRTINGKNHDIGPNDRMRVLNSATADDDASKGRCTHPRAPGTFPRIVLRDTLGYELDTFTTLQEAIYRAKWLVKQTGEARTSLEWRLPKAPAPARPDFTRSCPPAKHPPKIPTVEAQRHRGYKSNVLEFDVDDVGFVRESLEMLPFAPSLSFLRQEILSGPKTYFQIVGTMLLHKKMMSQTEKRDALYNFPGFCQGCTRMGLCYGCEKGTGPHHHEDKPVRTGGGYTYFKKDRPEKELKSKNPVNWRISHPDQALKELMEEYAGVGLDGEIPEEVQKILDEHGGHLERRVPGNHGNHGNENRGRNRVTIPNFAEEMAKFSRKQKDGEEETQDELERPGSQRDRKPKSGDDSANEILAGDEGQSDMDRYHGDGRGDGRGDTSGRRHTTIGAFDPIDASTTISSGDITLKSRKSKSQGHLDYRDLGYHGDRDGLLDSTDDESNRRKASQTRHRSIDKKHHYVPKVKKDNSDMEDVEGGEGEEEADENENKTTSRGRRREKLYKPPPAFKLKKSPTRKIMAKSPFSTERSYDLPKGKAFEVKKSDKATTKFKEFNNVDASWKEPKKFELKKVEQKATKFWAGPPKSKNNDDGRKKVSKSRSRSPVNRKIRRVPSPKPLSPDSGLDSEFLTATKQRPLPRRNEKELTAKTIPEELSALRPSSQSPHSPEQSSRRLVNQSFENSFHGYNDNLDSDMNSNNQVEIRYLDENVPPTEHDDLNKGENSNMSFSNLHGSVSVASINKQNTTNYMSDRRYPNEIKTSNEYSREHDTSLEEPLHLENNDITLPKVEIKIKKSTAGSNKSRLVVNRTFSGRETVQTDRPQSNVDRNQLLDNREKKIIQSVYQLSRRRSKNSGHSYPLELYADISDESSFVDEDNDMHRTSSMSLATDLDDPGSVLGHSSDSHIHDTSDSYNTKQDSYDLRSRCSQSLSKPSDIYDNQSNASYVSSYIRSQSQKEQYDVHYNDSHDKDSYLSLNTYSQGESERSGNHGNVYSDRSKLDSLQYRKGSDISIDSSLSEPVSLESSVFLRTEESLSSYQNRGKRRGERRREYSGETTNGRHRSSNAEGRKPSVVTYQGRTRLHSLKFSNHGGLSSQCSNRDSPFLAPIRGSSNPRRSTDVHSSDENAQEQPLHRKSSFGLPRHHVRSRGHIVYKPMSDAVSPIHYMGDNYSDDSGDEHLQEKGGGRVHVRRSRDNGDSRSRSHPRQMRRNFEGKSRFKLTPDGTDGSFEIGGNTQLSGEPGDDDYAIHHENLTHKRRVKMKRETLDKYDRRNVRERNWNEDRNSNYNKELDLQYSKEPRDEHDHEYEETMPCVRNWSKRKSLEKYELRKQLSTNVDQNSYESEHNSSHTDLDSRRYPSRNNQRGRNQKYNLHTDAHGKLSYLHRERSLDDFTKDGDNDVDIVNENTLPPIQEGHRSNKSSYNNNDKNTQIDAKHQQVQIAKRNAQRKKPEKDQHERAENMREDGFDKYARRNKHGKKTRQKIDIHGMAEASYPDEQNSDAARLRRRKKYDHKHKGDKGKIHGYMEDEDDEEDIDRHGHRDDYKSNEDRQRNEKKFMVKRHYDRSNDGRKNVKVCDNQEELMDQEEMKPRKRESYVIYMPKEIIDTEESDEEVNEREKRKYKRETRLDDKSNQTGRHRRRHDKKERKENTKAKYYDKTTDKLSDKKSKTASGFQSTGNLQVTTSSDKDDDEKNNENAAGSIQRRDKYKLSPEFKGVYCHDNPEESETEHDISDDDNERYGDDKQSDTVDNSRNRRQKESTKRMKNTKVSKSNPLHTGHLERKVSDQDVSSAENGGHAVDEDHQKKRKHRVNLANTADESVEKRKDLDSRSGLDLTNKGEGKDEGSINRREELKLKKKQKHSMWKGEGMSTNAHDDDDYEMEVNDLNKIHSHEDLDERSPFLEKDVRLRRRERKERELKERKRERRSRKNHTELETEHKRLPASDGEHDDIDEEYKDHNNVSNLRRRKREVRELRSRHSGNGHDDSEREIDSMVNTFANGDLEDTADIDMNENNPDHKDALESKRNKREIRKKRKRHSRKRYDDAEKEVDFTRNMSANDDLELVYDPEIRSGDEESHMSMRIRERQLKSKRRITESMSDFTDSDDGTARDIKQLDKKVMRYGEDEEYDTDVAASKQAFGEMSTDKAQKELQKAFRNQRETRKYNDGERGSKERKSKRRQGERRSRRTHNDADLEIDMNQLSARKGETNNGFDEKDKDHIDASKLRREKREVRKKHRRHLGNRHDDLEKECDSINGFLDDDDEVGIYENAPDNNKAFERKTNKREGRKKQNRHSKNRHVDSEREVDSINGNLDDEDEVLALERKTNKREGRKKQNRHSRHRYDDSEREDDSTRNAFANDDLDGDEIDMNKNEHEIQRKYRDSQRLMRKRDRKQGRSRKGHTRKYDGREQNSVDEDTEGNIEDLSDHEGGNNSTDKVLSQKELLKEYRKQREARKHNGTKRANSEIQKRKLKRLHKRHSPGLSSERYTQEQNSADEEIGDNTEGETTKPNYRKKRKSKREKNNDRTVDHKVRNDVAQPQRQHHDDIQDNKRVLSTDVQMNQRETASLSEKSETEPISENEILTLEKRHRKNPFNGPSKALPEKKRTMRAMNESGEHVNHDDEVTREDADRKHPRTLNEDRASIDNERSALLMDGDMEDKRFTDSEYETDSSDQFEMSYSSDESVGSEVYEEATEYPKTFELSSPPILPDNVNFDDKSLTSREPDMDLVFDDIIDVANIEITEIEVVDPEEEERLRKEERRRKKHKHKKRKRREDKREAEKQKQEIAGREKSHDDLSVNKDSDNDERVIGTVPDGGMSSIRKVPNTGMADNASEEEQFLHAIEMISNESPAFVKKKHKMTNDSLTSDLDEGRVSDTGREQNSVNSRNKRWALSKAAPVDSLTEERSVDSFNSSMLADHEKDRGNEDMQRGGKRTKDTVSKTRKHNTKEKTGKDKMKPASTIPKKKQKTKVRKKSVADLYMDKLPSVQSQLSKILQGDLKQIIKADVEDIDRDKELERQEGHLKQDDHEEDEYLMDNESEEDEEDKANEDKEDTAETEDEAVDSSIDQESKWQLVRPKSMDMFNIEVNGTRMATPGPEPKGRSMSMPLLTDIEDMLQSLDLDSVQKLKEPFRVPVYLPGFGPGNTRTIIKKQFKNKRKRVPARSRSRSICMVNLFPWQHEADSNKSELEPLREETMSPVPTPTMERLGTPSTIRIPTPEPPVRVVSPQPPPQPQQQPPPPKKREIVKKEKKVKPPSPPPPPPKPETPVTVRSPTPEVREEPPSREISFDFVKEPSLPELPPIEVPELPIFQEKESDYKEKKKERKLIEVTPELAPQKKKLPPPPKVGPRINSKSQARRSKVAEAPVTNKELQQLKDPLDFLAKYCIINPDRLPYYERVFTGAVSVQTPRYSREHEPARSGALAQLPQTQLSVHEIKMLQDMTVVAHAQTPRREGISAPEQYLEKLSYSVEFIKGKQDLITNHMNNVQGEKIRLMAAMAREMDRDITKLDYQTKGKKKKEEEPSPQPKKKKKKKGDVADFDKLGAMGGNLANFKPTKASDITDEVIVSRMDDKMLKKAKKDPNIKRLSLEVGRDIEKLKHYDQRVTELEDEKDLVGLYCMDYYFSGQVDSSRPHDFRRQQSRLYQKLHPDPDVEMNIEEVEVSLQQINNKLLTDKEFQYIYFILDLPKREKINFRLFTIIAALSEKVTQMDPVIRKLLNKVDYNALDVKMERSKELFELLHDEEFLPRGNAPADNLAVELTAGGLTPEHTSYVMSKFNREGRGLIDFLDFVTYVPLFIEIHKRIIEDPFNESLDV